MSDNRIRMAVGATLAACVLSGTGCSADEHRELMASTVTMENQWASSAETEMAAVFGTLSNTSDHEARIVSGESPIAGRVETTRSSPMRRAQ